MGMFDPFTLSIGRNSKQSRSKNEKASAGPNAVVDMITRSGSSARSATQIRKMHSDEGKSRRPDQAVRDTRTEQVGRQGNEHT